MPRAILPAIACVLILAFITTAARKDDKKPADKDENAAGLIDTVTQLEQRIAALEKRIKELEKQLEDKTNPFGRMKALDKRIATKLQDPIPVNFEANRLVNIIDYFRNTTGCTFFVNWNALEGAGVEQDTPITLQMKNIAAAHALKLVLIQASPKDGDNAAVFEIHDGVVYITTKGDMKRLTK